MPSSFTTPLEVEYIDGRSWRVEKEFDYLVDFEDKDSAIRVPEGFITDFASIPRVFWTCWPPTGMYGKAAVVHDYLYVVGGRVPCPTCVTMGEIGLGGSCPQAKFFTKAQADRVFRDAMEVLGVKNPQRWIMWQMVQRFGKGNFGK